MDIKKKKVILLSGKKQVGKDTFANVLYHDFLKVALADELKYQLGTMLAGFLGYWTERKKETSSMKVECKEIFFSLYYNTDKKEKQIHNLTYKDGKPVTPRNSMQWYGQMIKEVFGQNIWVDTLIKNIESMQQTNIVVTDCRFKYELEELKTRLSDKFDVSTIRIKRNTGLVDSDISEISLDTVDDSYFDFIVENNGSEEEFKQKVLEIKSRIANRR